MAADNNAPKHPVVALITHHLSYCRLQRAMSWLQHVLKYLRTKLPVTGPIILWNEKCCSLHFVYIFFFSFDREFRVLHRYDKVRKWITVLKLTPVLDGIGLIVIGGRLSEISISQKSKFPVILPSDHKVSCIITYDYHDYAHLCTEQVLSNLRTLFWITRAWGMIWNYRHKKHLVLESNYS